MSFEFYKNTVVTQLTLRNQNLCFAVLICHAIKKTTFDACYTLQDSFVTHKNSTYVNNTFINSFSVPHFNYSLPCPVNATGFIIRNTHDDIDHDAGTKGFTILDLISKKTVVNATLGNIQNMVSNV